jgi:NADP-dependent 3-hydroxy acid dehydrogenase YdfG
MVVCVSVVSSQPLLGTLIRPVELSSWLQKHVGDDATQSCALVVWRGCKLCSCAAAAAAVQAEASHMLAQGYGKIINTASMASLLVPHPQKQAAYNASKAAGARHLCLLTNSRVAMPQQYYCSIEPSSPSRNICAAARFQTCVGHNTLATTLSQTLRIPFARLANVVRLAKESCETD